MVKEVSDEASSPLLACLDRGGIFGFGDSAMVGIVIDYLLFIKRYE